MTIYIFKSQKIIREMGKQKKNLLGNFWSSYIDYLNFCEKYKN